MPPVTRSQRASAGSRKNPPRAVKKNREEESSIRLSKVEVVKKTREDANCAICLDSFSGKVWYSSVSPFHVFPHYKICMTINWKSAWQWTVSVEKSAQKTNMKFQKLVISIKPCDHEYHRKCCLDMLNTRGAVSCSIIRQTSIHSNFMQSVTERD